MDKRAAGNIKEKNEIFKKKVFKSKNLSGEGGSAKIDGTVEEKDIVKKGGGSAKKASDYVKKGRDSVKQGSGSVKKGSDNAKKVGVSVKKGV